MADDPKNTEKAEPSDDAEADDSAAEDGEAVAGKKRFGLKLSPKKLLMFGLPLILALSGGGYFAATMFGFTGGGAGAGGDAVQARVQPKVYFDLPEMVVNLNSGGQQVQYLKLKVSLEAKDQVALDALMPVMPRILDTFQLYLRGLRSTDLEGSAGIFRLKEELLRRVNVEIQPNEISRVLFKEIIVQ